MISESSSAICSARCVDAAPARTNAGVHLQGVVTLLRLCHRDAQLRKLGAVRADILLGRSDVRLEARASAAFFSELRFEHLDFPLPREHAVQLGIGRMEAHAVARVDMSFACDEHAAGRQLIAQRQARRTLRQHEHVVQPLRKNRFEPGVAECYVALKRFQTARRTRRTCRLAAAFDDRQLSGSVQSAIRGVRKIVSPRLRAVRAGPTRARLPPGSIVIPCHTAALIEAARCTSLRARARAMRPAAGAKLTRASARSGAELPRRALLMRAARFARGAEHLRPFRPAGALRPSISSTREPRRQAARARFIGHRQRGLLFAKPLLTLRELLEHA